MLALQTALLNDNIETSWLDVIETRHPNVGEKLVKRLTKAALFFRENFLLNVNFQNQETHNI